MTTTNPTSPKVIGAVIGAAGGVTLSTLVLWVIGVVAFGASSDAGLATGAVAAVPAPLAGAVLLAITVALTFLPGYTVTDPMRLPTLVTPEFDDLEDEVDEDYDVDLLPDDQVPAIHNSMEK